MDAALGDRTIYIIGGGGHAHVIASFLQTSNVRFVVTDPKAEDEVSATEFFAGRLDLRHAEAIVGIGDNGNREEEFERVRLLGVRIGTCVAPNAFVARDATLGAGTVVCAGAVIGSRAVVGANAIVNTLTSLDHDCSLGDHSHLAPGVTVAGTVKIGRRCFVGIKSAIFPNLTIGDDVFVRAGALVTRSVPRGVVVGGVPARVLEKSTPAGRSDSD